MITDKQLNSDNEKSEVTGKVGTAAVALAILAGVMAFTNPPREDYLQYGSARLASELKTSVCKESKMRDFLGEVGSALAGACNTLVTSQRDTMARFIDNTTQRDNFIILSIYTTEVGGHKYRTIGAFGNFLTFSAEEIGKS